MGVINSCIICKDNGYFHISYFPMDTHYLHVRSNIQLRYKKTSDISYKYWIFYALKININ